MKIALVRSVLFYVCGFTLFVGVVVLPILDDRRFSYIGMCILWPFAGAIFGRHWGQFGHGGDIPNQGGLFASENTLADNPAAFYEMMRT